MTTITKLPDGGPAFPFPSQKLADWNFIGMSLRDYFAAAALQGVMKDRENIRSMWESSEMEKMEVTDFIATRMYLLADAMLRARSAQ